MRCFETLMYLRTWADGPAPLATFVQEIQGQALARGVAAELVQPVAESDETGPVTGPLAMVRTLATAAGTAEPAPPEG